MRRRDGSLFFRAHGDGAHGDGALAGVICGV